MFYLSIPLYNCGSCCVYSSHYAIGNIYRPQTVAPADSFWTSFQVGWSLKRPNMDDNQSIALEAINKEAVDLVRVRSLLFEHFSNQTRIFSSLACLPVISFCVREKVSLTTILSHNLDNFGFFFSPCLSSYIFWYTYIYIYICILCVYIERGNNKWQQYMMDSLSAKLSSCSQNFSIFLYYSYSVRIISKNSSTLELVWHNNWSAFKALMVLFSRMMPHVLLFSFVFQVIMF